MRSRQQLCSFKDHLYDMLVAMMFRSNAGIEGEEEDVHGGDCIATSNQSIFSIDEVRTRP